MLQNAQLTEGYVACGVGRDTWRGELKNEAEGIRGDASVAREHDLHGRCTQHGARALLSSVPSNEPAPALGTLNSTSQRPRCYRYPIAIVETNITLIDRNFRSELKVVDDFGGSFVVPNSRFRA